MCLSTQVQTVLRVKSMLVALEIRVVKIPDSRMQVEKTTEYFKNLFLNRKVQVYTNNKQNMYNGCIRYRMFKPNCDTTYEELLYDINHFYSIHHTIQLKHDKPQPMLVKCNVRRKDLVYSMYIKKKFYL